MNGVTHAPRLWHDAEVMPEDAAFVPLRLGPQGRVVIPAHFRRALGIDPGDTLIASLDGEGGLVLRTRAASLEALRRRFVVVPRDVDLAAELIAERREEARREATEERARRGARGGDEREEANRGPSQPDDPHDP